MLKWEPAGQDYTARTKDFIFLLHSTDIGVYGMGRAFSLRVRKPVESGFTKMGYAFYMKTDGGYDSYKKNSVDGRLWTDPNSVTRRAEQILKNLGYV